MIDKLRIIAGVFNGESADLGIPSGQLGSGSLTSIVNLVYTIAAVVAVIVIIVAGINYSLSAGDPQKAAKSRTTIIYAAVGLVVVTSAFAITNFVIGRF